VLEGRPPPEEPRFSLCPALVCCWWLRFVIVEAVWTCGAMGGSKGVTDFCGFLFRLTIEQWRRTAASGAGLWSRPRFVYGTCLPSAAPRPGSELPCKARLARPSDAAACDRGGFLFGSCSTLGNNRAAVMERGRCQFDHWMLLLFCSCILAFPGHGMPNSMN
jgi:hypothetical protein